MYELSEIFLVGFILAFFGVFILIVLVKKSSEKSFHNHISHFKGKIVMNKYLIGFEDPEKWDSYESYINFLQYAYKDRWKEKLKQFKSWKNKND